MSKFLKFIVHLIVIGAIVCVLGLAVPPFLGITTYIVDDSSKNTNLPLGSVTYAVPTEAGTITAGTPILVTDGDATYRYNVVSMDVANNVGQVTNPTESGSPNIEVNFNTHVPKIVVTIGYIGYLMMATKSVEGMIILGLAVLFLIILYVIAELWKKDPEEDYDFQKDPYAGYVKSPEELRQEDKDRARKMDQEDKELIRKEKKRKKAKKIYKTGGFVDEIDADDENTDANPSQSASDPSDKVFISPTSEAHEELRKEIAAATASEDVLGDISEGFEDAPAPKRKKRPVNPDGTPRKKKKRPEGAQAPTNPDGTPRKKKKKRPVQSAEELAQKAASQGDKPDQFKDEVTDVTLLDYSDIISEDK